MTTPSRTTVVRTIASSLAFDADPPAMRSLDKARQAAGHITDALVAAGVLPAELADPDLAASNGHSNGSAELATDPLPF